MSMHDYPVIGWGIDISAVNWNTLKLVKKFDPDNFEEYKKLVFDLKIENKTKEQYRLYDEDFCPFSELIESLTDVNCLFVVETACDTCDYLYLPAGLPWQFTASDPINEEEALDKLWDLISPYVSDDFTKEKLGEIVYDIQDTYYG